MKHFYFSLILCIIVPATYMLIHAIELANVIKVALTIQ